MAGEKRGDYSEAAVAAAIQVDSRLKGLSVTYHEVVNGCGVCVSDIILGPIDNPLSIIQITSSGYKGNFQQKFWRDAGELFEIKHRYPKCKVIQVLFKDGTREKLVDIEKAIWDGVIEIKNIRNGDELIKEIDWSSINEPRPNFEKKIVHARASFNEIALQSIASELTKIVFDRSGNAWSVQFSESRALQPAEGKQVNTRNGILDAILFSHPAVSCSDIEKLFLKFANGKFVKLNELNWSSSKLTMLLNIGLIRKIDNSISIADKNLSWTLEKYGAKKLGQICSDNIKANKNGKISKYCEIILGISQREPAIYRAILKNIPRWSDHIHLASDINKDYLEKGYLCGDVPKALFLEPWIVKRLFDVLRCAHNLKFYIGVPAFDEEFPKHGLKEFRFTYTDYLDRKRALNGKEVALISKRLSKELINIDVSVKSNLTRFLEFVIRSEYKQRYRAYRGINPGRQIVSASTSLPAFETIEPKVCSLIGVQGAATCIASVSDNAIFITQSATKGGVAHKVNELVGRLGLMLLERKVVKGVIQYSIDARGLTTGVYLDGAWSDKHVLLLQNAGFSDIRRIQ